MAKKINTKKKEKKAKPVSKPLKKAVKSAPKKVVKSAPKKVSKSIVKKVVKIAKKIKQNSASKKVVKPIAKKVKPIAKKAVKPATKKVLKSVSKKVIKPIAKKAVKPIVKKVVKSASKKELKNKIVTKSKQILEKKNVSKKNNSKPIEAIALKEKNAKSKKVESKKKGKNSDDDDDVEVKDDYEKPDEEDAVVEGGLEELVLLDLEGISSPEIDEDEDGVPEKRGRGRRKKNHGKSTGGSMEAYIRNRPLQIDLSKPLIKKGLVEPPKPFINDNDKRTRYSDKELAEFKKLILEKLKEAQTDYDLLKQTLSNEDNHGTDDTSPSFKLLEDGSDVMSKEETAQLAIRQEKYIVNLKNALIRIENKAYGICRVTGKLIPKERLRSVPHATLGIEAKINQSS
jgi:DnaK suppressor protein